MEVVQQNRNDVITESTWQELIRGIRSEEINVAVNQGNVALNGTVDSYLKKVTIEKLVSQITGVKSILNQIDVQPAKTDKNQDEEIKDLITGYLKPITSKVNEPEKSRAEIAYWEIFN